MPRKAKGRDCHFAPAMVGGPTMAGVTAPPKPESFPVGRPRSLGGRGLSPFHYLRDTRPTGNTVPVVRI